MGDIFIYCLLLLIRRRTVFWLTFICLFLFLLPVFSLHGYKTSHSPYCSRRFPLFLSRGFTVSDLNVSWIYIEFVFVCMVHCVCDWMNNPMWHILVKKDRIFGHIYSAAERNLAFQFWNGNAFPKLCVLISKHINRIWNYCLSMRLSCQSILHFWGEIIRKGESRPIE